MSSNHQSSANALESKLASATERADQLQSQQHDLRADYENQISGLQTKLRAAETSSLTSLAAAENQLRDANGKAYALGAELDAEKTKASRLQASVSELTDTVTQLRADLSSEGQHTESARSTAKERIFSIQREHERAVDKLELEWSEKQRAACADRDRCLAEKRVLEEKFREAEDENVRLRSDVHAAKLRMRFGETTQPQNPARAQPSPMFR